MNTKTTKFLAVLAVFAMAFAAFAVVLPAASDDATGEPVEAKKIDGAEIASSTTITEITKNLILEADKEYKIAVTVTSGNFGIYLLPGAKITMTDASETAKFTGIIFGAAVAKTEGNATVYYHATASKITFVQNQQALINYELSCNEKNVISITSTSKYLTQGNITVEDESANWGGDFSIADVVINENGDLATVTSAVTGANAGVDNATTVVKNKIAVELDGNITLNLRGAVEFKGGMEIKQENEVACKLTLKSSMSETTPTSFLTGDITAFSGKAYASKISADACNADFEFEVANGNGFTGTSTATSLTAGQLTLVSGEFKATEGSVVVGEKATLNIASGATLTVTSGNTLMIDGAMYLSGKLTSSVTGTAATFLVGKDNKDAVFKTRVGATMTGINFSDASKGSVDITTVLNEVGLSGQIESSNSYTASQVVTLLGDLTITNHAVITIHGFLMIPSGYTLKIEDGSVLIVDGIFSESDIIGDIEVSSDSALYIKNDKSFEVYGSLSTEVTTDASGTSYASLLIESKITAMEGSLISLAGATLVSKDNMFTVASGATAYFYGPIMTAVSNNANYYISNAGTIIIDGASVSKITALPEDANQNEKTGFLKVYAAAEATDVTSALAIKITKNGAIVDVEEIRFNTSKTTTTGNDSVTESAYLLVTDDGIGKTTTVQAAIDSNEIKIQADTIGVGVGGLVITEKTSTAFNSTDKKTYTKNNMQISGDVARTGATGTEKVTMTVTQENTDSTDTVKNAYKSFSVEDDLKIEKNVTLSFITATQTFVNGDVVVEENATISIPTTTDGTLITVNGSIESYDALTGIYGNCIGAQFKADTHSYIITTVHAAMTFAAVQEGKVTVTIYGANTITEDMYITANVKMVAGTDAKITIKKDVTVGVIEGASVGVNFIVKGTLYANVEKNVTGTVTADVKVTDGVAAKWTSLANALATAEAGDVILITNNTLDITDSLTIPAEVTVVIPDGTTASIADKKTLTVNGALVSDSTIALKGTAKIVVNGLARFVGSEPVLTHDKYKIDGAYYTEDNYVYVSNLTLAAQSEVTKIVIFGKVSESKEVTFALQTIELATGATLSVSDLILAGVADIDAEKGKLSGTVTAAGLDGEAVAIMHFTDYAGCVGNYFSEILGTAFIDEITGTVSIVSGTVTLASKDTVESDGTLNVLLGAEFVVYTGMDVKLSKGTNTGTIYVAGKLTINSDKFVNAGIIDVVFDEDDSIKGVLTVTEMTMEIGGITVDDGAVFNLNGNLTIGYAATSVDGLAAIEGVVTLANGMYIIAYANADVSEMIVNPTADGASTAKTTEFYINDMLYMTLIAGSTNELKMYDDVIKGNVVVAIDELDCSALNTGDDASRLSAWGLKAGDFIGAYDEVTIDLDYKLIAIQASWVKGLSLYVDGVRISVPGELKLSVGVHLVSVTVDAGYACDNIGITFNGVAVTPAGIFVEVDDTGSVLAVTGDVYIPEPEPVTPEEKSEWTITTILLVVLVILIAIMAVIVALRLNRS